MKEGYGPGEHKTTYITFEVKKEALYDLLIHPEGIVESFPTAVNVTTKHEYTRYDYSWKKSTNLGDNSIDKMIYYAINNENNYNPNKGKTHYTISETKIESAPYLAIQLYQIDRAISGKVFKDNKDLENNEIVGDGIYNSTEKSIQNVKVDLIDATTGNIAKIYTIYKNGGEYQSEEKDASVINTDLEGNYSFKGVIPGQYYVRFTYGNGEQKYYDSNGNEMNVYSNGYKSTIITRKTEERERVKEAFIVTDVNSKDNRWYLELRQENSYNLAVDNDITDDSFNILQKIDYRTQNNTESIKELKTATTPLVSVPIEFYIENEGDLNNHISSFNRMCFGIIERPKIIMNIRKEITNVKITLQNGQVLVNGNPASQNIPYVANLDTIWSKTGSSYVKVELDNQYMHGATLELIYTLTIENDSEKFYTTENYYKYGEVDETKEANIYVDTLLEYLDPFLKIKLRSDIKDESLDNEYTYDNLNEIKIDTSNSKRDCYLARKTLFENHNNNQDDYNTVFEIGQSGIVLNHDNVNKAILKTNIDNVGISPKVESREKSTSKIKVVAQKIISLSNEEKEDDLDYTSYAQISQIRTSQNAYSDPTAAPLVEIVDSDYWNTDKKIQNSNIPSDSSRVVLTPSTGRDKSMNWFIKIIIIMIEFEILFICKRYINNN